MILLCLKIFLARIIDVSLGTVRTYFIVKGKRTIAAIIAFVEIFIWFYAAREALNTEITSIFIVISYAAGYATGTYLGTIINEMFISGFVSIQVISDVIKAKEISDIKKNNFGISVIKTIDNKNMLFIETNKRRVKECINLIKKIDKKSFIIINDSKVAYNGYIKKK
ncbi:MAG: DUF5698 domain-containing protein [Bacilli bacterium]|nr:DUF5698 domain-containing protein [Bacilli bacterium]